MSRVRCVARVDASIRIDVTGLAGVHVVWSVHFGLGLPLYTVGIGTILPVDAS